MTKMRCGHETTARMFEDDAEDAAMVPVCLTCLDAGNTLAFAVDPHDELMERRRKIHDAWMGRVYHSKKIHGENSMEFWGAGITLDRDGTLRIIAFAPNSWTKLWELECKVGGDVTFNEVVE